MSYFESHPPICTSAAGSLELVIRPERKNLGEFTVARALPATERQMIGPFIFFDHMGPADFAPGLGIQVRPHPHIGIAAITYLFEGLVVHRDSLGYEQPIESGAVNLMVAGRGIVHSERAGRDLDQHSRLHGIQAWMALPDAELERAPSFTHYAQSEIPSFQVGEASIRLIIGAAFGEESPVKSFCSTLYLEASIPAGGRLTVPATVEELGAYVVSGRAEAGASELDECTLAVARSGQALEIAAQSACTIMVIGGEPVGHRELWWNFVARDSDRIEQAKRDWREGRFARIEGDDEYIPLPD